MPIRLILILIFLCSGVTNDAPKSEYCFQNDGLKLQQKIYFTLTGDKIEGTFESGSYDENTSAETFEFTGIKTGNSLAIKFRGSKAPYETPPRAKRIIWTLHGPML